MPGDFFKLSGIDGPDTTTAQMPSGAGSAFPSSVLSAVFADVGYFVSLTNPTNTAFGDSAGIGAGRVTPEPAGLTVRGNAALPRIFTSFAKGETIARAYLYSTASGGSGEWVSRFFVFGNVRITQFQAYTDVPEGAYPIQFTYAALLFGQTATAGGTAAVSGWDFAGNRAWNGVTSIGG